VLLGAIWGSSFLLIKIALHDMSPLEIVGGRVAVGALVLVVLIRMRGLSLPDTATMWRSLAVLAIVSNVIPFGLITWGEEHISSSLAAILNSTTPLFTAGIAAVVIPEQRMTVLRAIGIVLGFVGVGVIVGLDAGGNAAGQFAVLIAAASYGVGLVYTSRRVSGRITPLSASTAQLLLATLFMLVPAGVDAATSPPALAFDSAAAVFVLGAFGTGIAYVLFFRLIHDVGPTSASFVTYLIPLFGVVLGRVFLDEPLGWNALVGGLLVIAGIGVSEHAARRAAVQRALVATAPVAGAGAAENA